MQILKQRFIGTIGYYFITINLKRTNLENNSAEIAFSLKQPGLNYKNNKYIKHWNIYYKKICTENYNNYYNCYNKNFTHKFISLE